MTVTRAQGPRHALGYAGQAGMTPRAAQAGLTRYNWKRQARHKVVARPPGDPPAHARVHAVPYGGRAFELNLIRVQRVDSSPTQQCGCQ